MALDRSAIAIQPAEVAIGGTSVGYTETPFDWYPNPEWLPVLTEQLGAEPVDFDFQGFAAYGSVLLMQYDATAMKVFGGWVSSKTVTYPGTDWVPGRLATEITGATGALTVTPRSLTANRQKLTVYNGLITIAKGAALRWASKASVGMPLIVYALRDGSSLGWKIEPAA